MKKRAMYTVLLCVALLLSLGVAPVPANTAARLDEPYTSGDLIDVTSEAQGYGQNPLHFASALATVTYRRRRAMTWAGGRSVMA